MDPIFTSYRPQSSLRKSPDWLQEGHSLCTVSSQNTLLFTTSTLLTGGEPAQATWGSHVYCLDLNTPWDACLVTSLESAATCLAWNSAGSRFVCGDASGLVTVWEIEDNSVGDWKQITSFKHNQESFLAANFFLTSRPVSLHPDLKESSLYTEKFSSAGEQPWTRSSLDGCVLVSATGLLVTVAFPPDQEPQVKATSLGLGRRRIVYVDTATTKDGQFMVAACGLEAPIVVYTVSAGIDGEGWLDVRVNTHSSFSLMGEDPGRVCELKFLLSECTEALVVGVAGPEGGRVQMWDLETKNKGVHKLLSHNTSNVVGRVKGVPEWSYSDEFSGGGAGVVALATPRSSVMGGKKPACYVAVAFSDGSVQLLLRDSLAQIASVELPRGGNIAWSRATSSTTHRVTVTICSLAFTSTGNCLLVTDSLGQLYLYRMSPISDPGGPPLAPYIVTMLEYCLVSGKDWWDLAIAAKPSKLEAICDKFSEIFYTQPEGRQMYYFARFMAIKSSLYRLVQASQYRAADTTAFLMLKSINGTFKSLLKSAENNYSDYTDPVDKLEMMLVGQEEVDIEAVSQQLSNSGLARDLQVDSSTMQTLQQLTMWLTTLTLHLLAAVPEYKTRRGPGYSLLHDGQSLLVIRELLAMIRLWNIARVSVISTEKEMDLTARLFSMITRLSMKTDDESLIDECLMLPHKVMIPPLDTVLSPRGVIGSLHSLSGSPLSFTMCTEPDLPTLSHTPFLEGLTYTEDPTADFYYDSVQKLYLGQCPGNLKHCTRCSAVTQSTMNKSNFAKMWEKRWHRNCLCGGPWKINKE